MRICLANGVLCVNIGWQVGEMKIVITLQEHPAIQVNSPGSCGQKRFEVKASMTRLMAA